MEFKSISECLSWEKRIDELGGKTPAEIFRDKDAFILANSIIELTNVWDDLIDKDHEVPDSIINGAFYCALSEIPQNPFFARHRGYLQPLMDMMMTSYFCANEWEKNKDEHGMEIGHVIRYAPALVVGAIVNLATGTVSGDLPILYKAMFGDRRADYFREILSAEEPV